MEFESRINKVFVHPLLGDLLDNGEIDFTVLQLLEEILRFNRLGLDGIKTNSHFGINEFTKSPLIKAFFDCNLLWKSKYYDYVKIDQYFYGPVMKKWIDRRKQEMTVQERIKYQFFKTKNGRLFGWWAGHDRKDVL